MAMKEKSKKQDLTSGKITTPDELSSYLKITNVGVWIVLFSVALLFIGLFIWAASGTLETTVEAKIIVKDHLANVVVIGDYSLQAGDTVRIPSDEFNIASVKYDEYDRPVGLAEVTLPDGKYDGTVVKDKIYPIDFLLNSKE